MDRRGYFGELAPRWDSLFNAAQIAGRAAVFLERPPLPPSGKYLDAGTGTGIILSWLLPRLSPAGRVYAVDFSEQMLAQARAKHRDPRVSFIQADLGHVPLSAETCDGVLCFSTLPHLPDKRAALQEFHRLTKPGGDLLILHVIGRQRIAEIHAGCGEPIAADALPEGPALMEMLDAAGWETVELEDTPFHYWAWAKKTAP